MLLANRLRAVVREAVEETLGKHVGKIETALAHKAAPGFGLCLICGQRHSTLIDGYCDACWRKAGDDVARRQKEQSDAEVSAAEEASGNLVSFDDFPTRCGGCGSNATHYPIFVSQTQDGLKGKCARCLVGSISPPPWPRLTREAMVAVLLPKAREGGCTSCGGELPEPRLDAPLSHLCRPCAKHDLDETDAQ